MSEEPPIEDVTEDSVVKEPERRTSGSIWRKCKQAAFRHLKRELAAGLAVKPSLCKHNLARVVEDQESCGFCRCLEMDDADWPGICDDERTPSMAEGCDFFDYVRDKQTIKDEFQAFLTEAPLHEIAARYPDVAALLWVLREDVPLRNIEPEGEEWEPGDDVQVEIYGTVLTAASADEASAVVIAMSDLERGAEGLRKRVDQLKVELERAEKAGESARVNREAAERDTEEVRKRVLELAEDKGKLVQERDQLRSEVERLRQPQLPVRRGVRGWLRRWLLED